eukprot:TRINITY_DN9624_c0_g1_i1.p1 TRINITY_DN9624_c0_g1~~TRINITY_DN9624_c0_g1_i1.p1  ORF type:complete len:133 (-),score=10.48 TRINITY_DN9624_c0_g1_i1:43-414(-)
MSESTRFINVGFIQDLDDILIKYPITHYKYYGAFNNINPQPIIIQRWNRGHRVFFKHCYAHGDDAKRLHLGNAMWTRGTDDEETKKANLADPNAFVHWYTTEHFKVCCGSNGLNGLVLYVRSA